MKFLILGCNGMAGHTISLYLKEQGHNVKVFLIDDAIHWAQLGMADTAKALTGEEMKPLLDYLTESGAPIYACKA